MRLSWIAGLLLFVQPVNISESLSVTHQGQTIASVNHADITMPLLDVPIMDVDKYNQLVKKIDQHVYQKPVNATMDKHGNILPGRVGYKLYHQAFKEQFHSFLYSSRAYKIEVPLLAIHPKVDSELLAGIREKKIGEYRTYFNVNNKNRTNNISLATEAINNYVVFPGEVFSFNQAVGKRSVNKGYMLARVIVKGEFSEGIGGGICQVSSTLFNAIDNAGLQTIQRYSHTRSVPYVPSGRDATVSWYGPDFSFKNKYNQPILIRATTQGGMVSISVYSSDMINYKTRKVPAASNQISEEQIYRS
ncbi:VanW family protein [Peribacillus sp. V2I11]|uniref:VanW family protein n=1 Tax=Peribacillus sp. V2I11 TaxID=3042277 RepID=UPI00277DD0E0|nr:VanW family protein [Peribacillus sp. V2I11]MDQ0882055.1 vancomycin resistance protein YoaR [Peribacillus sp. V2I11]